MGRPSLVFGVPVGDSLSEDVSRYFCNVSVLNCISSAVHDVLRINSTDSF